jgi:hypothetical protein
MSAGARARIFRWASIVVSGSMMAAPNGFAQVAQQAGAASAPSEAATDRPALIPRPEPGEGLTVERGTRIPLTLINSASTKHSVVGDRVYLQTAFPILESGRVVIPPGSYVMGTVTEIKRPGRMKGRGEIFLRFDSLTLPNGVVRDFRARMSAVDASGPETLDRKEGKVKGDSNIGGDARTIGEAAAAGASIGTIAAAANRGGYTTGALAGAAAGAVAGMVGVLLTRGPDAVLTQGSTIEMVTDRPIRFDPSELNFGPMQPMHVPEGSGRATQKNGGILRPGFPF